MPRQARLLAVRRERPPLGLPPAASLRHEYGELAIAVETVSGAAAAIDHVNAHRAGRPAGVTHVAPGGVKHVAPTIKKH